MFSASRNQAFALCLLAAAALPAIAEAHDDRLVQIAAFFATAAVVEGPDLVDCTLSRGTQTTCFSITVTPDPQDYTPGPWCPTSISDTAAAGGTWFDGGEIVDVDGAFIQRLATLYRDSNWQLYDPETGAVRFTGTLAACAAAARPDVDPAYQNHCVQCLPEYMPQSATVTYVIPLDPSHVWRADNTRFAGSGVAYNGVRLDGPAPVDAILSAYTIAPFDDCGGHVNLHVGYHYHAVTDCLSAKRPASGPVTTENLRAVGHGTQIGIAMDGYQIFGHLNADGAAPGDLDRCNGHDADGIGYHYHAGAPGSNAILGCLKGEAGCALTDSDMPCDASARPPRP